MLYLILLIFFLFILYNKLYILHILGIYDIHLYQFELYVVWKNCCFLYRFLKFFLFTRIVVQIIINEPEKCKQTCKKNKIIRNSLYMKKTLKLIKKA